MLCRIFARLTSLLPGPYLRAQLFASTMKSKSGEPKAMPAWRERAVEATISGEGEELVWNQPVVRLSSRACGLLPEEKW